MSLFSGSKAVLGALGVAACLAATAAPASAQDRGLAAGVIGGLAAGAIVGGAIASQPGYYAPGYYAPGYAPAYGYPAPYRRCWMARQRVYDPNGQFLGFRRVRMCQ